MNVTNKSKLCMYSMTWVINILQHHIVFVEQYSICFRLSVFLNYPSISSPHTVTPADQEWNVFLKESLWYSLNVPSDLSVFSDRQTYIRCKRVPVPIPIKCGLRFNILFISIGPCIVIYSYSTTKKMHLLSQIIYSCITLYIFRTDFPPIIMSSKLRVYICVCVYIYIYIYIYI